MFYPIKRINQNTEQTIIGVDPQTNNEFRFYHFIESESILTIQTWYKYCLNNKIVIKKNYENAILQKIETGNFTNPHNFTDYFNNDFDFIAIDFETANKNRISACAIGLVFVKNDMIVFQTSSYIKPPLGEKFDSINTRIHGITYNDVKNALTFDKLWNNYFSTFLNNNLIIFHNASMDLSVLKKLFELYKIDNYNFKYIDTMKIAAHAGLPKKLTELTTQLNIDFSNTHDPMQDAKACAMVFGELIDIYPNYIELIDTLSKQENNKTPKVKKVKKVKVKFHDENLDIIQKYSLDIESTDNINFMTKGVVITGELFQERSVIKKYITDKGGVIKSGVTSKVDYIIIGEDFGWSKIQKADKFNSEKKCNIRIIKNELIEKIMKME